MIDLAKKLTNINGDNTKISPLTNQEHRNKPFMISIEGSIENNYSFKKLKKENLSELEEFLSKTVYKNLNISDVDKLFLRTPDKTDTVICHGAERQIQHYGKNGSAFRIHGYYHHSHFVITRIDPKHKVHK